MVWCRCGYPSPCFGCPPPPYTITHSAGHPPFLPSLTARARSLRRLRLSRSVWDCQRLLSVLLLSTRSFQRCAGRHVGPRNSLVLLLIKKFFFASGGAAQARGRFSDFSQVPDLSLPPSTRSPRPAGTQLVIQLYHHQSIRLAEKTFVSAELHPKTNPVVPYVRPLIKKTN